MIDTLITYIISKILIITKAISEFGVNEALQKLFVKLILIIAFQTFNLTHSFGQEEIIDHQLWFDVVPHFEINDRMEFYGDGSYRTSTSGDKFNRLMVRPSVRYHWTYELDLIGGLGLTLTWEEEDYNTVELRPYQGIRLNWPKIWRMNFKFRGLIEERLIWNNNNEFDPNLRLRLRVKTNFPINKPSMDYKTVYIPLSYEVFGNVGPAVVERFRNQSRAKIGLGYVFSEKWMGEFEFAIQRSRSTFDDDLILYDRIFRFKLTMNGWIFGE